MWVLANSEIWHKLTIILVCLFFMYISTVCLVPNWTDSFFWIYDFLHSFKLFFNTHLKPPLITLLPLHLFVYIFVHFCIFIVWNRSLSLKVLYGVNFPMSSNIFAQTVLQMHVWFILRSFFVLFCRCCCCFFYYCHICLIFSVCTHGIFKIPLQFFAHI